MKEYRIFEEGEEFYEDINSDDNPFDDYLKIEGKPNLVKDPNTNAVINIDEQEYERFIENSKKQLIERKTVTDVKNELDTIKNEINEIKDLLRSFIQNK